MPAILTIKQLHAATGRLVRAAARSRTPTIITDRGRPVAILAAPNVAPPPRRRRSLLPEYERLMRQAPADTLLTDLDAVREDR